VLISNAVADVRNNVFYARPSTAGSPGRILAFAMGTGTVNMSHNWVPPNAAQFWFGHITGAKISGWNTNIGANNQPMFVDEAAHDYRPASGSSLINAGLEPGSFGLALPLGIPGITVPRKQDGQRDIGAFEF
jgi:hypothetical protein